MAEQFSRHVNEQYRWRERLISRLNDNLSCAIHFRWTHDEYLSHRAFILESAKGLTRESRAYVDGYMRARDNDLIRDRIHFWRIAGRPETATGAKWNDMPEELRQACRDHNAESALCWDDAGQVPFSDWKRD
jgi:hypothetical protein